MLLQKKSILEITSNEFELKLKLSCILDLSCILATGSADNVNASDNNITFNTKDTKQDVSVVTFSAKDNQKVPKLLSKGSGRSVYWNEYKIKSEGKYTTNKCKYFLESGVCMS